MKLKIKTLLAGIILPAAMLFAAGCGASPTPYEVNDGDGYTVSVRYDANGGTFDTNTSIMTDSFNISDMKKNDDGTVDIALLAPDDARRGSSNSFTPTYSGYFLAGFYSERIEGKDESGNLVYSYGGRWDFESSVLKVDSGKEYSAEDPVMTLYAAWIPLFKLNIYNLNDKKLYKTLSFNPTEKDAITLPCLDSEGVSFVMNDIPQNSGFTYNGAYLDAEGKEKVEGEKLVHHGRVLLESGTAENASMDLYVSWLEGEIYNIYTAEQFVSNYNPNGTYIIHNDLDFTDAIWPSALTTGSFSGKIEGNGHSIKNVSITQNDNSKTSFGLFGQIGTDAAISDISFENATVTIAKGIRVPGSSYGMLAGVVSDGAGLKDVSLKDCVLAIDAGCYFGTDDYSIGTVCGMGNTDIDASGVQCTVIGDNTERLTVTTRDGNVTVTVNE